MLVANFALNERRLRSRGRRLVAVFCQGFAGKQNLFFSNIIRTGGPGIARIVGAAIVETALLRATGFETAVMATAILVAARIAAARFAPLGRSVLGRRQISSTRAALRGTSAAAPAAAPTPAAAVSSAVTSAIIARTPIAAAPVVLATVIAAVGARRIVLRWVVLRREVLRRGSVGLGLALVERLRILVGVMRRRFRSNAVVHIVSVFDGWANFVRGVFVVRSGVQVGVTLVMRLVLLVQTTRFGGASQRFPWKNIDVAVRGPTRFVERASDRSRQLG